MSYLFASRPDGQPGCCRCGEAIDPYYRGGQSIQGPPVIATKEGWLSVCASCYKIVLATVEDGHDVDTIDPGVVEL